MSLHPMAVIVLGGLLLACGTVEPRPTTSNDSLIAGPPSRPARSSRQQRLEPRCLAGLGGCRFRFAHRSLRRRGGTTPDFAPGTRGPVGHSVCDVHSTQPRVPVSFYYASEAIPVRIRFHRTYRLRAARHRQATAT